MEKELTSEAKATFDATKRQFEAERTAVEVVRAEATDISLVTIARAKARLRAYEEVYENYERYIKVQAEALSKRMIESPYKELGVARLVALWIAESEQFLKAVEPLLGGEEKKVRRGYLEQSFEQLSEEVKDQLLEQFNAKKLELLQWFVGEVQREIHRHQKRQEIENDGSD